MAEKESARKKQTSIANKTTSTTKKSPTVEEKSTSRVLNLYSENQKKASLKNKSGKTPIQEVQRYLSTPKSGLTTEQVEKRKLEGLTNFVEDKNTKTYKSIFLTNIVTFFNMLCFAVAIALLSVGAFSNIAYMVIVLANITIGIIQEIKAKNTIEKINLVNSPTARVIRDGFENDVLVVDLVLDDIVVFSTGKQISADSIVIEGEVEANESLLTGESVSVKKKKGDILYSGSFIVSGKCFARVDKVGNESYSAKLADKAKQYKKPKSELLASLRLVIKSIGVIIIPLAVLMYLNNYNQSGGDITTTIKTTAGSIIGMIPAGMFLLTSMALAVGVIKLAKKRTLVQDLYSIEMLARADVLCLDKTGTITDGTMKVNTIIQVDQNIRHTVGDIVGSMLTALDENNQTSRALISHFGYSKEMTALEILPFNSTRKLSAVTFKNGETYAMGAPEFILNQKHKEVEQQVKQYAIKGFRVLLVAKCEGAIVNQKISAKRHPVCLIIIEDHIREDAAETIDWFKSNGVAVKIISGDNPLTVSEVSRRVGVEGSEKFIDLDGLSEQQVIDAAEKYTVFGRVSPEQKSILVKALKSKGHKVAMTGDGVNDILALKEADCSIAMASGSEATRHVSHLVLLDSNFSSMPSVVAEGRRVVNNVQNSSSLFLMKTIFTILLSIFCLLVKTEYPFITLQIIILETCIVGIPSFFLALQPNSDRIKGNFLLNLLAKSIPAAILFTLNVMACYMLNKLGIVSYQDYVTMASLVITFIGLVVLYRLCKPFDIFRGIMFTAMVILITILLTVVPESVFEYSILNLQNILFVVVFVETSYPIYSSLVKFFDERLGYQHIKTR